MSMTDKRVEPGSHPDMAPMPRPAAPGVARYEPGMVEVQFRPGLMPCVIAGGPGQGPSLAPGVALDDVNQLLRRYLAVSAEPTFTGTVEEGASSYKYDFVTLHFPSGANIVEIAEQLNRLSEVERAVALPSALPPRPG